MGCFVSCFRDRPESGLYVRVPGPLSRSSDPLVRLVIEAKRGSFRFLIPWYKDPLVRGGQLWDALSDLDTTDELEARETQKDDLGDAGGVDDDLRREANYLKSWGTISETPPELLKISNQNSAEYTDECNDMSSDAQTNKGAVTHEEKDNLSERFSYDEHDSVRVDQKTDEGDEHAIGVEPVPLSSLNSRSSRQKTRNQKLDSSDSPFPTPLVLRDDTQTPGTIYTSQHGNFKSGKRGRIGKQFIYPVLNPIENKLQWAELRDDSSPVFSANSPNKRHLCADSIDRPEQTVLSSIARNTEQPAAFSFHANNKEQYEEVTSPEEHKDENGDQQLSDGGSGDLLKYSSENGKHGVASLSCWLKTSSADGQTQSDIEGNMGKQQCYQRSFLSDAPIFVASGLNWDYENPTPMLPKAWDGNGIPNTTTKYKEDQKVSWHATPFEERLMKVLSDEKPHHQRKISGKLIQLEEDVE